jgi:hypothetical protein
MDFRSSNVNRAPAIFFHYHTSYVTWSYSHASSDICWENTILHIVIQFNFENNTQILSVKVCIHFFGGLCIWQRPDWFLFWNSNRWQAHEVGGTFCKPLLQDYGHKWTNRFGDVYSVWNGHVFQNRSLQFRTEPWDWIWLFVSTSLSKNRREITGKQES